MRLSLGIVGPRGTIARHKDLDAVIARRREPGFERGSEVVILSRHAPLLMQTCAGLIRWRGQDDTGSLEIGQGVLEVRDDEVTVVVTGGDVH